MQHLNVNKIHSIYIETYGTSGAIPFLFLHGGPGLGCSDSDQRFFDPEKHFVIYLDQRGSGKSIPLGELEDNATHLLIEDINNVLDEFQIDQVILFGGSWGSTLSLTFAIHHPHRVQAMILRSIFLADKKTTTSYENGVLADTNPKAWERYMLQVPKENQSNPTPFYYQKILGSHKENASHFAFEFLLYAMSVGISNMTLNEMEKKIKSTHFLEKARVQAHFVTNDFFLQEDFILNNVNAIQDIPTHIIHGRDNQMSPVENAKMLASKLNNVTLKVVSGAHAATEPEIEKALLESVNYFSE